MTAAADLDPYLLPLPTPGSPVVLPHLATSLHAHLNGRYADPVWPLAPLTENPSQSKKTIRWALWPAPLRDEMRLAAWNLINGQLRPTFLQGHSSGMRSRLSLSDTYSTAAQWKQFARWLAGRGTGSLAECSTSVLHDYGRHLRDSGRSRGPILKSLVALTRLWAFDQLSARPNGIERPPWEELGIDDYLPAATTAGGENATEPLAEQTIGPLLTWAMRTWRPHAPSPTPSPPCTTTSQNGGGLSGPAARRAIRAAAAAPRFDGTPITLASARRLLANEDAMIYDNPHALVLCHYKRDKALCHRDEVKNAPSLDRCVPGCGNIARTDQQAAQLRDRALALETQAAHVPQPVGDRLRATAAGLRGQAGKHDRTRITTAGKDAG